MKAGVKISNIIKRSVSFSPTVNQWAEDMARARGHENNFSGFLAELIREAMNRDVSVSKKAGAGDSPALGKYPAMLVNEAPLNLDQARAKVVEAVSAYAGSRRKARRTVK